MAKLPKISELTSSVPGVLDKFKSMLDNITGPSTAISEADLQGENDPLKVKLMEIELLINQLHDIQLIQARTINGLKAKHAEMRKVFEEKAQQEVAATADTGADTSATSKAKKTPPEKPKANDAAE